MTELSIAIAAESLPSVLGDCVTLYHKVGIAANDMRGCLLRHVRDTKLYRQDYPTFEAFAEAELGLSRSRAYQLIDDYEVRANLSTIVDKPSNEGQARELAKLPAEEQAEAWEEVVTDSEQTGEKITAKKVQQVVARRKEPGQHLKPYEAKKTHTQKIEKRMALVLSHDPVAAAMTLVEFFDRDYLTRLMEAINERLTR